MTGGDIDRDGDVDLWVTQYKPSYEGGQMPTPYYDANDGEPAYLLVNDGKGQFIDETDRRGLAAKRFRRTYSTSFVDLDEDADLDLIKNMVVSDYAGIDLYENDGNGTFEDVTQEKFDDRHLFGMAHTFADFNSDGRLDLYAIGMSSTTARRLDRLQLGRADRPRHPSDAPSNGLRQSNVSGDNKWFSTPSFCRSSCANRLVLGNDDF